MSNEMNTQESMFKLIRIFVVQYLNSVHSIKGFEQEAINIISSYIMKTVKKLTVQTKRLVGLQGRKEPNCLSLIYVMEDMKFLEPITLIKYLVKQREQNYKGIKFQYLAFQNLSKRFFQNGIEEINGHGKEVQFGNIRSIPYNYTYDPRDQSLLMTCPVDQCFKKPQEYTYTLQHEKLLRNAKNVEMLGSYSVRETKKYLGIITEKQLQEKEERKDISNIKKRELQMDQDKFDMINFI